VAWTFGKAGRLRAAERASGLVGGIVGRWGRRSLPGGRSAMTRVPAPGSAWTGARDLPAPPPESFRAWWKRTSGGTTPDEAADETVGAPGTPRPTPGTPPTTADPQ